MLGIAPATGFSYRGKRASTKMKERGGRKRRALRHGPGEVVCICDGVVARRVSDRVAPGFMSGGDVDSPVDPIRRKKWAEDGDRGDITDLQNCPQITDLKTGTRIRVRAIRQRGASFLRRRLSRPPRPE